MTMLLSEAMPTSKDARFWDRIADGYAKKPVPDEAVYQEKLRITREYLAPHMKIFEFGCGTGSTAIAHAPFVQHVDATDISAKMISIAQDKARAAGIENVRFRQMAIDDLGADAGPYDAVLGLSILHLVADPPGVVSRIFDMLKPGGVFVSSTVCMGDGLSFFRLIGPIGKALGVLPLLRIFTADELTGYLTGAGFSIEHSWKPVGGRSTFIVARKPT